MTHRITSIVVGFLLLTAAALKLHGFTIGPVAHVGILGATWFQFALIEFEVLLGVWLLWGGFPIGSWIVALMTFLVFAGFSFYAGWIGEASCRCFGKAEVSPWWAFGLDVGTIVALSVARPPMPQRDRAPRVQFLSGLRSIVAIGGGVAVMLSLFAIISAVSYGSLDGAIARIRGEVVTVTPRTIDVGKGAPGQPIWTSVELTNRSDRPMRVIGGTSDCSCSTHKDLPATFAPGASRSLAVRIVLPASEGIFRRKIYLLTDHEESRRLELEITGRVIQP